VIEVILINIIFPCRYAQRDRLLTDNYSKIAIQLMWPVDLYLIHIQRKHTDIACSGGHAQILFKGL